MSESQKRMMEETIYKFSLWWANESYHDTVYNFSGVVNEQNHNAICNSSFIVASLSFMDIYPELCSMIVSEAIRSQEYFIDKFAPAGALLDGPAYAQICVDYEARLFSCLDMILGNSYGLEDTEGLDQIANYLQRVGSDVASYNFGDGAAGKASSGGLLYLSKIYNQPELAERVAHDKKYANNKDLQLVSLLTWYEPNDDAGGELDVPLDSSYSVQGALLSLARDTYDEGQVFVGVKAGSTAMAYHTHHDAGSFVYDALGFRWAYDLGSDDYNLTGYMQPQTEARWNIFRLRPEGHNTLVINPADGYPFVMDSFAPFETVESKPRGMKTVVDMSAVQAKNATSAKRGFLFTDDRKSLVIRDEVSLPSKSEVYWLMYTKANAEIKEDSIILWDKTDISKKIAIEFRSSSPGEIIYEPATPMEHCPNVAGQNTNGGYFRIMYKVVDGGDVNITAKITPLVDILTSVDKYDVPISTWTIPDGEIREPALLDKLVIGGEEYDVNERSIVIACDKYDSPVLDIQAVSSQYNVEIVKGESVEVPSYVFVTRPDDPETRYRYVINYNPKIKRKVIGGYDLADIVKVTASDEPQEENKAENVLDGDFSTRWSAERDQTLLLELMEPQEIDTFIMALWLGDQRTTSFEIYLSEDNVNYKMVYEGGSSGKTEGNEMYDLGGRHKVKYIKLTFHGASNATWNSVLEVAAGLKQEEKPAE